MKKNFALVMAIVCMLTLVGCSNSGNRSSSKYEAPTRAQSSYQTEKPTKTEAKAEAITEAMTEAQTESQTQIDWTEFSYDTKDNDSYTYKVTIKLSPWILYSETDTINSAWSVVGKDNSLPTFESWGFKHWNNEYWKPYSHGSAYFDSGAWGYAMNDMYYCVGNVSIKNTTENWDITSSSKRTAKAQMTFEPRRYGPDKTNALSIAKIFYSDSSKSFWSGIDVSASMKSNSWGPASFVFMAPENFSPNHPNGEYLETLRTGYFLPYGETDAEKIRVNIIGKSGEKFSPVISGE